MKAVDKKYENVIKIIHLASVCMCMCACLHVCVCVCVGGVRAYVHVCVYVQVSVVCVYVQMCVCVDVSDPSSRIIASVPCKNIKKGNLFTM